MSIDFDIQESTKIAGVYILKPSISEDTRGNIWTSFLKDEVEELLPSDLYFKHDKFSTSKNNVLRGIHGDNKTWKLVSCLSGKFFLVVVNWDSNSSEYQKWISFEMDASNPYQILIPPKFGNGHLITSKEAIFHYKQSTLYDRESQFTIYWNDIKLNIPWPIKNPIISKRDKNEQ